MNPRTKQRPVITLDGEYTGPTTLKVSLTLAILSLVLGCTMLLSNILATKVWGWKFFTLDGGFFLFPLSYVLGDILVELYGKRIANTIATWCAVINLCGFGLFHLIDKLPDAPGVSNLGLSAVLGMSGQVIIGSSLAFFVSQRVNNGTYDEMRRYTHPDKQIWVRAWWSSAVGRFFDTLIFVPIAFWGRLGIWGMLKQGVCAFLAGMLVESIFIPFTCKISRALRHTLTDTDDEDDEDDPDDDDDYDED